MIDFQLEPQAQKPLVKTCGNCRHFKPYVDQATKRVHPSKPGRCGWEHGVGLPMPIVSFGGETVWDAIIRHGMISPGRWQDAQDCKCWEEK